MLDGYYEFKDSIFLFLDKIDLFGFDWYWNVLIIILGIILAIGTIISLIKHGIIVGIKYTFKLLWFIVTSPFRLIYFIFKKVKSKKKTNVKKYDYGRYKEYYRSL